MLAAALNHSLSSPDGSICMSAVKMVFVLYKVFNISVLYKTLSYYHYSLPSGWHDKHAALLYW